MAPWVLARAGHPTSPTVAPALPSRGEDMWERTSGAVRLPVAAPHSPYVALRSHTGVRGFFPQSGSTQPGQRLAGGPERAYHGAAPRGLPADSTVRQRLQAVAHRGRAKERNFCINLFYQRVSHFPSSRQSQPSECCCMKRPFNIFLEEGKKKTLSKEPLSANNEVNIILRMKTYSG